VPLAPSATICALAGDDGQAGQRSDDRADEHRRESYRFAIPATCLPL
jgi:hypothetical protein